MKKVLCGTGLVMLGAVLTMVGCGGAMQEGDEEVPTNSSAEGDSQPSASVSEQPSQKPEDVSPAPGEVNNLAMHCYVHCHDTQWAEPFGHFTRGPFAGVTSSRCASHGKSFCRNNGWKFEGVSWK